MIGSRVVFVFLLVFGPLALGSLSAQQGEASRGGGVAWGGHPEWKPQRAVFVADKDRAIWIVENPEAVTNFPAAHVLVAGNFDSAKKSVHVEKITPAAQ